MAEVVIDGCAIHYEMRGEGEPVLMLHGLGSCALDWEPQLAILSARYRTIAVDLRGHGSSGKPDGPYSMSMFAADVVHVLETLDCGPAHVVGLSMGGMVGFQLALDAPALVRSLVVVNSAPAVVPRTLREHALVAGRRLALRLLGLRGLAERVAARNLPDPAQIELRRALVERIAGNDLAAYRAATGAILGWTVEDRLGELQLPVLIVTGDRDYTPVAHKRAYAAKIARAQVAVVERSSHVTPVDQPEAFHRLLLDFLDEQSSALARERVAE
jgi:pimeloyl-ACP methyl ester carboxylesterase